MTTTVRSVRVELEAAVAGYIRDMRLAGSETDRAFSGIDAKVSGANRSIGDLDKSTGSLSRTSAAARVQHTGLSESIKKTGSSAGSAEKSIDKYSGRLKTILGLIALLGPAALRLGAGALPAVSAGLAGIGALGGGIGVTVLALHGVGDALGALNDYELERTPVNLAKVQQAFAEIGPEGAHFVQFLRDLGPEIDKIQQLARAGVLPGFEEGIESLVTRLPIVSQIVNRLSQEVGTLAADAGDALAGDRWTPFFEYVRSTAAPTLDDFARSAGNVALGLANILVAFDPLTRRFTGGLEDMTDRFADWSEGLEDDRGFQSFLDTVEEAGPELLDFLGSTISLLAGLASASAPLAATTLPILTGIVKVFAAVANSPVGPALYTAAAALLFFNKAGALTGHVATSVATGFSKVGTEATTMSGKISVLAARGGGIAAVGAAVGILADNINRIDSQDLDRSLTALSFGDVTDTVDKVVDSLRELNSTKNAVDLGEIVTAGGLFGDTSLDKFADNVDQVDQSLAQMVESGNATQAAALFRKITELAEAEGVDPADITKGFDAYAQALDNVDSSARHAATGSGFFASSLRDLGGGAEEAAAAATDLSNALAILDGWLSKRAAVRGYKDAIDGLVHGLKDGFSREDVDNIDAVGQSILQVAEKITNPARRAAFLENARSQLEGIAKRSGPEAAAAIQKVVDKFDSKGLTKPPPPLKLIADTKDADKAIANTRRDLHNIAVGKAEARIDADDAPAQRVIRRTHLSLDGLNTTKTKPKVEVDPGNSLGLLATIRAGLAAIKSKHVVVTVTTNQGVAGGGGHTPQVHAAAGGTVPGPRAPYGDKVHAMLAPGEEVISNRHGQADRFRSDRASGRIPSYANGGTVEDRIRGTYTTRYRGDTGDKATDRAAEADDRHAKAADRAAKALKKLENAASKVEKALDRQKSKLEDLISQRDSTASSIASTALHDPFGNGLAGLDTQLDADSGDLDAMTKALATLVANGLDPKSALYQQLAAHMDVNTAQQLAQLTKADLASRAQRFDAVQGQAAAFGQGVAGDAFNEAIRDSTKTNRELRHTLQDLRQEIHEMADRVEKGAHKGSHSGSKEGSKEGSEEGTRAGQDEKRRRTAASVRAGGGSR